MADHAAAQNVMTSVLNLIRQEKGDDARTGSDKKECGRYGFQERRKRLLAKGEKGARQEHHNQPEGGKSQGYENPTCQIGADCTEKIVHLKGDPRPDSKQGIAGVIGKQADPQEDSHQQKKDALYFFFYRLRVRLCGSFRLLCSFCHVSLFRYPCDFCLKTDA